MSGYKAPTPCDSVREPFFSRGYCVACGWLVDLHTVEGWARYHNDRAEACRKALEQFERRVVELRHAVEENETTAGNPPEWTPFEQTGYVSVHEPRRFPTEVTS